MTVTAVALFPNSHVTGSALVAAQNLLGCPLESVDIITSSTTSIATLSGQYSVAVSFANDEGFHNVTFLGSLARHLQPNATIHLVQPQNSNTEETTKSLLLSGFLPAKAIKPVESLGAVVTATMPSFVPGAGASLSLKRKPPPQSVPSVPAVTAAGAWTVPGDDLDDNQLIDEDTLLTEEDLAPPPTYSKSADDCEVGAGRKACKDCTCGRAEQEASESVKLTKDMLVNPTSSCGSCYLGDAFRCSGCPYRGLPAFEPNKKIELPSSFLVADA